MSNKTSYQDIADINKGKDASYDFPLQKLFIYKKDIKIYEKPNKPA